MASLVPLFVAEATAARLLDLPVWKFRELVESRHLPRGREIAPGVVRWSADDLRRIASGEAIDGMGDVRW